MNPQASIIIKLATSTTEIEQCFPIMSQLRTDLSQEQFVQQVQAQMKQGYQLAYIKDSAILGVAGFKLDTSLAWGKHLYLADLVGGNAPSDGAYYTPSVSLVVPDRRSQGYGAALFSWLTEYAQQNNCQQFHLDSGVQRFAAHRFYLQQKMHISSHHFTLNL